MTTSSNPHPSLSTQHLPYPLAWSWNEVLVAPESSHERQTALQACLLSTLQFLVSMLLADYARGPRNVEIDAKLKEYMPKPSNGHWLQFWILIVKYLEDRGKKDKNFMPFLAEAYQWYHGENGNTKRALDFLLETRNKMSHGSQPPSRHQVEANVGTFFGAMENVLDSLRWLERYSLIRVCDAKPTSYGTMKGRLQLFRGNLFKTIPLPAEWRGVLGMDGLYLLSHERDEALLLAPWIQLGVCKDQEDLFILNKIIPWETILCKPVALKEDVSKPLYYFEFRVKDQKVSFKDWWDDHDTRYDFQKLKFLEPQKSIKFIKIDENSKNKALSSAMTALSSVATALLNPTPKPK